LASTIRATSNADDVESRQLRSKQRPQTHRAAGVVVKDETLHFEYIAAVPVLFGL
jgi:6,7-dimethyl-8-ribityllumazine synthase